MKAELLGSSPPGSVAAGWIQREREREFYAKVQTFCLFYEAIYNKSHYPDIGWSLFSFEEYRGDRL